MSVAATWIAMGYLPIARLDRFCVGCVKCEASPQGLRCTQGHFYVNRTGGCRSHVPVIAIHGAATAQESPLQLQGAHS
jgi:hypothetical protein